MMKTRRSTFLFGGIALLLTLTAVTLAVLYHEKWFSPTHQAPKVLKIGVLGTMSGPGASWGQVCHRCAQVTANMYNERGGVMIDGDKYTIALYVADDAMDPKLSLAAAEHMALEEGIKYIIGPNVDDTTLSILPVTEAAGTMNTSYGFDPAVYTRPKGNSILGMVATAQSASAVFAYLKEHKSVRTVAFLSLDTQNAISQLAASKKAASNAGLTVLSTPGFDVSEELYKPGAANIRDALKWILPLNPDAIFLPGLTPADGPVVIKSIRDSGYKGAIATDTAQEAALLKTIGASADGFLGVGASLSGRPHSPYMLEFTKRYEALAGRWDDEAGTKAYALEMILHTLQIAGKGALQDVELFKAAIPKLNAADPFVTDGRKLKYTGKKLFGQLRQIDLDIVVAEFRDGRFEPVFVGSIE